MIRVLSVDDEPQVRSLIREILEEASFENTVRTEASGAEALAALQEDPFDVVLLDVGMPEMDGFQVLEAIRGSGSGVPVILLTGVEDEASVVKGLTGGADDYVGKPFSAPELLARVQAVVRRARMASDRTLRFQDVEVDVVTRRATRSGTRLSLTPTEFDLLMVLLQDQGKVLSRDSLLKTVWELDFDPGTNVLDVHLSRLRTKLEALGPRVIHTVRGKGFILGGA